MKYFAQKIIKFITMASLLDFELQIPNVIVLTVMFILRLHTRRRSDTDVQFFCTCTHSQNRCETVSLSILKMLQKLHRAEPNNIAFCYELIVGSIRIKYLFRKLRN